MKFQTVSMDAIGIMSEEEIGKTLSRLDSMIITTSNEKERKLLEKEHAYYAREKEIRELRSKSHLKYVETLANNQKSN